MKRRKRAHAQAHHMRAFHAEMRQHRGDVAGGVVLSVRRVILGNVGGRIAASVEGYASVIAREPADLRLPLPVVRTELMDKDERMAGSGLFEVELSSR